VQSATKCRFSSWIDQWHWARRDRNAPEKAEQTGPKIGGSSRKARLQSQIDRSWGQRHSADDLIGANDRTPILAPARRQARSTAVFAFKRP
jgi:hypothetical protein